MKRAWTFLSFSIFACLAFGAIVVSALAFELGTHGIQPGQTLLGMTFTYAGRIWTFFLYPSQISDSEELNNLGHSVVLAMSLLAILLPTILIFRQLSAVGELVLYEKFDLFFAGLTRYIPFIKNSPIWFGKIDGWRQRAYRRLAVGKMAQFYCDADQLLIISGHYSWLFDNVWSEKIQEQIHAKLPQDIWLVSFKSPQDVADHWKKFGDMKKGKAIFAAISFVGPENDYHGSIVKTANTSLYIYLYREAHRSMRKASVCAFHGMREADALVRLVEAQLKQLHKLGLQNIVLEAEKKRLLTDPAYFG